MLIDLIPGHQNSKLIVVDQRYLVDLVRGSESIHKVKERDTGIQRGDLRNDCHIVSLLDAEGGDEGQEWNYSRVASIGEQACWWLNCAGFPLMGC